MRLIWMAWTSLIVLVVFSLVALLQNSSMQSLDWHVSPPTAVVFYTPSRHRKPTPRPCRVVQEKDVRILFCNQPMETLEGNEALRKHPNWSCDPHCRIKRKSL